MLAARRGADGPVTGMPLSWQTCGPAILYVTRRFIEEIVQTILSDQVLCIAKQLKTSE
jgi:hypothetical protein